MRALLPGQVFIHYSPETHPEQTRYMGMMPSEEIMEWLGARGLSYWAMGWPLYKNDDYRGEFLGTGFNFRDDKATALLFKLTFGGAQNV